MNWLEDAFWSARASQLASKTSTRTAILVRLGRLLAQGSGPRAELDALDGAGSRAHGATLYVSHAPDPAARGRARAIGVRRIVLAPGVVVASRSSREWELAGIRIERLAEAA